MQKQQRKGQKATQRSALEEQLEEQPSPYTSDDTCRKAITAMPESKRNVQAVPRRVSLVSPSPPTKKIVYQVSDTSLQTSDVSSTSSSTIDEDLPRAIELPSLDMFAFTSPPRSQKRPRAVFEGGDLRAPSHHPRYAQEDAEEWKLACVRSPQLDDLSLPTFDEAARLFGYSLDP
jgi:hypothetical protein